MKLREVNIKEITRISEIVGDPLPDFEAMSNSEIAALWVEYYDEYPAFFEA